MDLMPLRDMFLKECWTLSLYRVIRNSVYVHLKDFVRPEFRCLLFKSTPSRIRKVHLGICSQHSAVRGVAITAYATAKFRRKSELSLFEVACEPCRSILIENEALRKQIDAVLFSSCSVEQYGSSIISEMLGLNPRISHRIDNMCNSGTNAIVSAFSYISSGLCDSVLVVGAEKIDTTGHRLTWDVTRGDYGLPVHW